MNDIWTDNDTKTCDFFAQQPTVEVKKEPSKKASPRVVKVSKPLKEAKAKVITEVKYAHKVELCAAVVRALEIVTVDLGYNLVDLSSDKARKHRRDGWHTFCLLIKLMCNSAYTIQSVSNAITVPNKPCKEVLIGMFEHCREYSPHSEKKLRQLIS